MVHGSGPSSSHGMDKEKNPQEEFTYLEKSCSIMSPFCLRPFKFN